MRVLCVGAAGYVGGAVVEALLGVAPRHMVRVTDSLLYETQYLKSVPFRRIDVRDREAMLHHLEWADCVVWLAALVGDGACAIDPALSVEINHQSVAWLADNFRGRIIFPSTCSVYGAQDEMLDEQAPVSPLTIYAQTKLAAEQALFDSNALILRLGTLFGAGDTYSRFRTDLVVNTLSVKAALGEPITIHGGEQWRPLLHVKDVADLIAAQVSRDNIGIYNLVYQNVQIKELVPLLQERFPDLKVNYTEQPAKDQRNYRVSALKAHQELNFSPWRTIEHGITQVVSMILDGRLPDPWHPRFSNERHLKDAKHLIKD